MGYGNATVSAYTGPGRTIESKIINNIRAFFVNMEKNMLYFYMVNDDPTGPMREFEIKDTMTMTTVIANGVWTITVDATP